MASHLEDAWNSLLRHILEVQDLPRDEFPEVVVNAMTEHCIATATRIHPVRFRWSEFEASARIRDALRDHRLSELLID